MRCEAASEIMVVDDTPANLQLLTELLTARGYRVRPAATGELAVRSAAAQCPDLVLLDIRLPDLDGFEVCRRIKASGPGSDVPVIFIRALHDTDEKLQGFEVGGVDYVTKPFVVEEVLARVKTHLELRRLQQRLEQAQAELERRVEARTAELALANRALQQSEERLRLAIEATSDGVWDWNLWANEVFFSDRWYTMLDYAPGEFAASYASWRDRVHPNDLAAAEAAIQAHLDNRSPEFNIEFRMRAKTGVWKWLNGRGKVIERDAAGNPLRMVGTHVDITARKRAEEALRASEHKFRAVVQNAQAITFFLDGKGVFLLSEGQGLARLGLAPGQVVGLSALELYQDYPSITHGIRKALSGELTHVVNVLGDVMFDTIYSPYYDPDGQLSGVIGIAIDITERRRAETALRDSEARLRTAIENIPFDFFLIDINGRYVLQNAPSKKNWGDVIGKRPEEVTDDAAMLAHWNNNNRRAFAGEIIEEEALFTVGDKERCIHNIIAPIKDCDEIRGIVGLNIDITERKRAEAELQRHREHLEELVAERTAELRQAMTQLVQSEKLAALGSLVAGVAHELNTPLGNARVVASSLGEHLQDFAAAVESGSLRRSQVDAFLSRGREAVDLLERNAARAADLINHFKQVAVDQTSTRRRSFNLRQTVEEVLVTLRPQFKHTAHRIALEIPPDLALDSYPGPLEQVIANLVSNSLTHGFAGMDVGCIRIEAAPLNAGCIRLRYGDDGAGIPEPILHRIFEPFFTTRLGSGGSGLGLYIVYNLVTGVLGGTVHVHNPPGLGVAFDFILPTVAPALLTPALCVS